MGKLLYLRAVVILFILPVSGNAAESKDSLLLHLAYADSREEKLDILSQAAMRSLRSDVERSLSFAREMMLLLEQEKNMELRQKYTCSVALILLYADIYDKSLELFLKSLKISEELGDSEYICANNNNIGGVYLKMEDYNNALLYFQKAFELSQTLLSKGQGYNVGHLSILFNNLGLVLGKLGKKEEGIRYIEKAIEIADTLQVDMMGQYYANLTELYYVTGQRDKALWTREKSMAYYRRNGNLKGLAELDCLAASLLYQNKEYDVAYSLLDRSFEMASKLNSKILMEKIYTLRVRFAKDRNDRDSLIVYMERLYRLKNDLINEHVLSRIASLKLGYEFDKRFEEQRSELEKTRLYHRMVLSIVGMLLVVLIVLYWGIRMRIKKVHAEKEMLEKDLEFRDREMTTAAMSLMKNADLLREIILRLAKLKPNLKSENTSVVKEVIRDLQSLTQNDMWEEFEVRFNRVHVDFYKNLQAYCPNLSPTELKVCAFLRLNMSSKEISTLMGINPKSVDILRARIRKRLNITNTSTNLVTFLADF